MAMNACRPSAVSERFEPGDCSVDAAHDQPTVLQTIEMVHERGAGDADVFGYAACASPRR